MKIAWMYPKKDKDSRTTVMAIEFAEWLIEQKPTEKIMVSKNFIRNLTTEEMYHKWLRHLDKVKNAHKKKAHSKKDKMKLSSFKFQDGKVFWLPEYPEEPPYIKPAQWNQAVAQSLASAIEVAPEDRQKIKCAIYDLMHPTLVGKSTFIGDGFWQPENGKVYSAECEMETKYQLRNMANDGWIQVSRSHYRFASSDESFKDGKDYRQVARLKPMKETK